MLLNFYLIVDFKCFCWIGWYDGYMMNIVVFVCLMKKLKILKIWWLVLLNINFWFCCGIILDIDI